MSTPVRLLAFLAVLAAVLLAGFGLGRAVGPFGVEADETSHGHTLRPEETTLAAATAAFTTPTDTRRSHDGAHH